MNNSLKYILIGIAILFIAIIIYLQTKPKEIVKDCYNLPGSADPTVFGPVYWNAFHDLAKRVPCPGCRSFAEKFISYFHDVVNVKLGKPLFDSANYNEMKLYISNL